MPDELNLTQLALQEVELRAGQPNDLLKALHNALGEKSSIFRTKVHNAKSQRTKNKFWDEVHRVDRKIRLLLNTYWIIREALHDAAEEVQNWYQEIKKEHLKISGDIVEENWFGQHNDQLVWFRRLDGKQVNEED
jgi:hypothetical protein